MKHFYPVLMASAVVLLGACGESKPVDSQKELDSLRTVVQQQNEMLNNAEDFVQLMNAEMDSVVNADGNMIFKASEGGMSSREKMKQNLQAYKQILNNQREKINTLRGQLLNQKGAFAAKMKAALDKMQEQLDAKDAEISRLQQEIENKNIDIQTLQNNVEQLNTHVDQLVTENREQSEKITAQDNKMHEAYYIVDSKKNLKQMGLVDGGGVFKKSKLNTNDVDLAKFTKIDIRSSKVIQIPDGSPTIMSQHPAGSYSLTKKDKKSSTLTITDAQKFWSVTRILVVRY